MQSLSPRVTFPRVRRCRPVPGHGPSDLLEPVAGAADQYPGTDRLTFSNLSLALRRVVVPRLLDQRGLHHQRPLLERVVNYQYLETVPAGSQQLLLASFVKVRGADCWAWLLDGICDCTGL